ncbi:hypothetical protein NBO_18g0027 [Nosema bombycis CQ1]|uniref:Uncharacterized protein n=1 Tax=Nosema bombycis (strain CQ1 / CVCC 102059) TaxID=578461 RepID=R0MKD0_NOSB1|nr:hypothetical protein NBO_18g0027 [Nosema bombycis CQ1]|eukprot:EOB14700.1 hypothetical protein NBO_18g0027 [Nosema bombycis CQ1]
MGVSSLYGPTWKKVWRLTAQFIKTALHKDMFNFMETQIVNMASLMPRPLP